MQDVLQTLMTLTEDRRITEIKHVLTTYDSRYKGGLFEEFLTALYNGNGYLARRNGKKNDGGADVLLYHPKNPCKVIRVIQAKNHAGKLGKNETRSELVKFEEESRIHHDCPYFSLFSIHGYTKDAYAYEAIAHVSLKSWQEVEELITHYDPTRTEPTIDLYPHNEQAFRNIMRKWSEHSRTCAIQATGTGKTYLILKAMSVFSNQRKLVLAPGHHIFDQITENGGWMFPNTTYMTYSKLIRLSKEEMLSLDPSLIVMDEFHRIGADKWGKQVEMLLDLFPNAKMLGTTATPIRYLDGSRNMATELFANNEASQLSLADAIVRNILPMPRYVCALYTIEEEINKLQKKISSLLIPVLKKRWATQVEAFQLNWETAKGIPSILQKHITTERKFIVFCKNKASLAQMEWLVESWFQKANLADGIQKYRVMSGAKQNQQQLQAFIQNNDPDEIKLLFSIDMLNEGLHVESVDGVILLRPTESPTIFYQQIGRAIQANKQGSPLIFDFVNNFNSIRAQDFIYDVEKAQRSLTQKRTDAGLSVAETTFTISDETRLFLDFEQEMSCKLNDPWACRYEELVLFHDEFGHVQPYRMTHTHRGLRHWCEYQQRSFAGGYLTQDRIDKLKKIGFELDIHEEKWRMYYGFACTFHDQHPGLHINQAPSSFSATVTWWETQQLAYEEGQLSEEKREMLQALGIENSLLFRNWDEKFDDVKQFYEITGHFSPPQHGGWYSSLIPWIKQMRKMYQKGTLLPYYQERLNDIGFVWSLDEYEWNKVFSYAKLHYSPDTQPVISSDNSFGELKKWIKLQRSKAKRSELTSSQHAQLLEIGVLKPVATEENEDVQWDLRQTVNFVIVDDTIEEQYEWIDMLQSYQEVAASIEEKTTQLPSFLNRWAFQLRQFWNSMLRS